MTESVRRNLVCLLEKAGQGKPAELERLGDEAKTSMFVFLCLYDLFRWDPFWEISPQKTGHGFIDYFLEPKAHEVSCYVEVKRFKAPLRPIQIRKYLVSRKAIGRFRIGVLTNLHNWQIYAYSPDIGPREPVRLLNCVMKTSGDFKRLEKVLTYSRGLHGFKPLRDKFVNSATVQVGEIVRPEVLPRIASKVRAYLWNSSSCPSLPRGNEVIERAIRNVLKGRKWRDREDCKITSWECTNALLNRDTLEHVAKAIRKRFKANLSVQKIRRNLREFIVHRADGQKLTRS
ncbi:MAG: hypothetical protein M5U26_11895 [Planctomycetota bacterium]|nr:hypothetical protein [Planctomycetota bacterium]